MFGLGNKHAQRDDSKLPVYVQAVDSPAAFALAVKLWTLNERGVQTDESTGKEFLHLGLIKPAQAVWVQRDVGRTDTFEIILTWDESRERYADIYVVSDRPADVFATNDEHARQLLNGLLTAPSTLPAAQVVKH